MTTAHVCNAIATEAHSWDVGPDELKRIREAWLLDIQAIDKAIARNLEIAWMEDPVPGLKDGYVIKLDGEQVAVALNKDDIIYKLRDILTKTSEVL